MATKGDEGYVRPPVRSTVFTVYFEPFELDLATITELRNKWTADYPAFTQSPPKSRRKYLLPPIDIFELSWPSPAAQMADSSLSHAIAFQFDQFSITWKFDADSEAGKYPGYSELADKLIQRFSEFVSVVGSSVAVQGCQCHYTNSLDEIGAHRWLVSLLTGEVGAKNTLDGAEHFGFRTYRTDELEGVTRGVAMQMDSDNEISEVDISVVAIPADDTDGPSPYPSDLARKLLDSAHELENQTFEASFSETMKQTWREGRS